MSKRFPMPLPFGWFGVAYSDELAVGEIKPIQFFGQDMVLFRGEDNKPVVLEAFCPHLGAHLGYGVNDQAGGRVVANTITCPFHAWKFNDAGECIEVPYATNMPPKVKGKQCLLSYPAADKNQVIWVWYHPQGAEPMWELQEFEEVSDPDWAPLVKHEWIIKTHPQEMGENSADPARSMYVHGVVTFPEWEINYEGPFAHGVQRAVMQTPKGEVNGAIYTNNAGPGQTWARFAGIAETFLMGMVTPIDAETVHVRFAFTQPLKGGEAPMRGVEKAVIANIVKKLDDDKLIWENKVYHDKPILCDGDGPIAKYRKWYSQFYA